MKKIIIILIFLFILKLNAFATDACDRLVPQQANFIGEITFHSNLRDYPCISKSSVLGVGQPGNTYEIISKVDGWYQIKSNNGEIYRIWEKGIQKTNEIVKTKVKNSTYTLTSEDKVIINKFIYKVEEIIKEKGVNFKDLLVSKIVNLLDKGNYSERLTLILEDILEKLNEIDNKKIDEEVNSNSNNVTIDKIDYSRVKNSWLSWYNSVRNDLGESNYSYDDRLEQTALDWSIISKSRGDISHKRDLNDGYYDYSKITSWFKDRGVVCKNINRITHTENIGWGTYSCNDGECTDELINSIKSSFDFFLSEKDKAYKAHYESIVNPYFRKIGLGIQLEETKSGYFKYYLTVHFCTELL